MSARVAITRRGTFRLAGASVECCAVDTGERVILGVAGDDHVAAAVRVAFARCMLRFGFPVLLDGQEVRAVEACQFVASLSEANIDTSPRVAAGSDEAMWLLVQAALGVSPDTQSNK